jgi:CMP-N,N'-diacetyllegionaminic acid synthase
MRILGVIPARGGSKGIPKKNIAELAGRPLISYTLSAAFGARSLDRVVVSTDDTNIALISRTQGAEVLMRPEALADDVSTTQSVLLHVVERLGAFGYRPDAVMTLQPTSPLRSSRHIDEASEMFIADPLADSLVSCIYVPHNHHPYSVMRKSKEGYLEAFLNAPQPTRRQDKETVFARNGAAIYITRTENLKDYIFGGRLVPYIMSSEESIDIDTQADLIKAEQFLRAGLGKNTT